jgi:hypothetical protein
MRYSVVLPRIEPKDTDDARRALDRAHALWEKGEQRAALDLVRKASESADAAGQKGRAMQLTRAVSTLSRAVSPSQFPAPAAEPLASAERAAVKTRASTTSVTEPPSGEVKPGIARPTVPAMKTRQGMPIASLSPESGPVRYGAPAAPVRPAAVSGATPKVARPVDVFISSPPAEPAAPVLPESDVVEDAELVVTIAPADWALASPSAIVGHGAQRVAVAPGRGPGGTMMVRPLAPGEVAPKGSIVAVMVALEPGVLPLPRTG